MRIAPMKFAKIRGLNGLVLALAVLFAPARGLAEPAASDSPPPGERIPWQQGPKQFDLGHDVSLDITDQYAFLEKAPASKLLEKNGNVHNEDLLGMVVGTKEDEDWFVVLRYEDEGYIKDDEKIDADDLLKNMREGQEEANKDRQERGFEPLTIGDWQEPPHYDRAQHHLVWGLNVIGKSGTSVNYNTRILGRRGFVSLNLVTDPEKLAPYKPHAAELLTKTTFRSGARYEDFNKSTDKMAEYGLGGLILAGAGLGAAKLVKIGLLAKFGKVLIGFLIAAKKLIVVAALGLGAFLKNLFKRKTPAAPAGTPPTE